MKTQISGDDARAQRIHLHGMLAGLYLALHHAENMIPDVSKKNAFRIDAFYQGHIEGLITNLLVYMDELDEQS